MYWNSFLEEFDSDMDGAINLEDFKNAMQKVLSPSDSQSTLDPYQFW